jgi:hypothetical protein
MNDSSERCGIGELNISDEGIVTRYADNVPNKSGLIRWRRLLVITGPSKMAAPS